MSGRDRTVLIAIVVVAVLGAAWVMIVSPERKQANQLAAQVSAAQAQLATAEGSVASARSAQAKYAAAYTSIVSLGKAVPTTQEVPALIDELTQASNEKSVDFQSITSGSSGSSGTSGSAASAAASAAFVELPFTFTFEGSYFDLEHLFSQLTDFATPTASGGLDISGRLLTIQSVKLSPAGASSASNSGAGKLTGSITATAYSLPASQGVTGTTSASSPAGATAPASTTGAPSSPTPSATVSVNP
jgi:Tfp pilus assembly protein PilO